jgi:acetyl-CoA carboxylase biotin carboxyl carrier protein
VDALNHEQIEALAAVLKDSPRLAEIEIRSGGGQGVSLRLRRPLPAPEASAAARPAAKPSANGSGAKPARPAPPATPAAPAVEVVRAGLVGIFRPRRKGAPAAEGDYVTAGDVLGHIEAMRLLTDCVATADGRLSAVLVQDGQPVEYDQPLFEVRPGADDETGDDETTAVPGAGAAGEPS